MEEQGSIWPFMVLCWHIFWGRKRFCFSLEVTQIHKLFKAVCTKWDGLCLCPNWKSEVRSQELERTLWKQDRIWT